MTRSLYGFAKTPTPVLGGLDLAGLFMHRKTFVRTGLFYSKIIAALNITYQSK
jgi:hypothetical protein